MRELHIPLEEYARRRKQVLRTLKDSVAICMAGEGSGDHLHDTFRPLAHFEYLTGITEEVGAVLLLDPRAKQSSRREVLFLQPRDPEVEQWDGVRPGIDQALRDATGIQTIMRLGALPTVLTAAATHTKRVACLHPLARYDAPVSADLQIYQKMAARIPQLEIIERTEILPGMRAVKSKSEIAQLKRACDITKIAYDELLSKLAPGMTEWDVQETLEHQYKSNGSRGTGYGSIAGTGVNATILHYRANRDELQDGDLVCIDSAAKYKGYCSDVTRTFPVNGRFTDRQREVYEIVLKAQVAAIKACKVGATLGKIDAVARSIISKAGYGDYYPHSIGHHLGMEVHDAAPQEPLREGAVVTIEPGIYLPDEAIGIRIEDDILITAKGPKNLTPGIPKKVADIEAAMKPSATAKSRRKR